MPSWIFIGHPSLSRKSNKFMSTLNDITTELFKLLQAHRGTPVMQRINAFMCQKTERNMTSYLADKAVADDDKKLVMSDLLDILKTSSFDKLPALAGGQAGVPAAAAARPVPVPSSGGACGFLPAAPVVRRADAVPAAPVPRTPVEDSASPEQLEQGDPMTIILQQMQLLKAKASPAPIPSITPEEVRLIVRFELAVALELMIRAIKTKEELV